MRLLPFMNNKKTYISSVNGLNKSDSPSTNVKTPEFPKNKELILRYFVEDPRIPMSGDVISFYYDKNTRRTWIESNHSDAASMRGNFAYHPTYTTLANALAQAEKYAPDKCEYIRELIAYNEAVKKAQEEEYQRLQLIHRGGLDIDPWES